MESLAHEIDSLKLDTDANRKIRDQSEAGIKALTDEYNKIIVNIGYGDKKITMKEYDDLLERDQLLAALEAGGVDNWEWYDESRKNAGLVD